MNKSTIILIIFTLIIVYLYSLPKYALFLPTIPIYKNSEADLVFKITETRNYQDEHFFKLTDPTVVTAFSPHVKESEEELNKIVTHPFLLFIGYFLKYLINRPRPYQINKNINYLESKTGNTPALPAGHAFQAYYLAHVLTKKYPDKKIMFQELAKRCDDVRVKAGIHYPSDGELSKKLVDFLIFIRFI
jgi:hypothetical protein